MNDTLKWVLATLVATVVVFAGGEVLGVNWILVQDTILAFLKGIGMVLLLFSGSFAAIEVAKYYGHKNRQLEQEEASPGVEVKLEDLRRLVTQAVTDATVSEDEEMRPQLKQQARQTLLDLEETDDGLEEDPDARQGARRFRDQRRA